MIHFMHFAAEDHGGRAVEADDQCSFFKAGFPPGEEIEIIAMFFIGIDDHGIQTGLRHGFA